MNTFIASNKIVYGTHLQIQFHAPDIEKVILAALNDFQKDYINNIDKMKNELSPTHN